MIQDVGDTFISVPLFISRMRPRKPDPEKVCSQCGKPMQRKRYNGVLQSRFNFRRSKYCNKFCEGRYYEARADKNGNLHKSTYHKRARRNGLKDRCEEPGCEEREKLEVHHKDGNHENNEPENQVTLCVPHHKKADAIRRREEWKREHPNDPAAF